MAAVTLPPVLAQAFAAIALGLLGVAGIAKMIDPEPTSGALRAARLPSGLTLSRALGGVEFVAAVAGLAVGGVAAAPGALLYLGFSFFTASGTLNKRPIQSCGCFGREDTPPSWIHVAYNSAAVAMLAYVALNGDAVVNWTAPGTELLGYAFFAALGVHASYLLLSSLPKTMTLARTR